MWKQKLGISLGNHYSIPTEDIIKIAKAVGFDAISPEWEKDVDLDAVSPLRRSVNCIFSRFMRRLATLQICGAVT
ncbi:MAG: hypothetical protein SOW78_06985 [Clostridia bacterium]|nr:hypothetical protein [Clostridia bacterium]